MPSIRRRLIDAFRDRVALADPTWHVQFGGVAENTTAAVRADVYWTSDDQGLNNSGEYEAHLYMVVILTAGIEDADPTLDEGHPDLYLERLLAMVEAVLHEPDDGLGLEDRVNLLRIEITNAALLAPFDEDEPGTASAALRVTLTYRRDFQDPSE